MTAPMILKDGLGWLPDEERAGWIRTANPGEYGAELQRLTTELKITERVLCIVLGLFRTSMPQATLDLIYQHAKDDVAKASVKESSTIPPKTT